MATVLRYKVFSALRNASRSCSFSKLKSLTNVRFAATAVRENPLKRYQEMSVHQCLLIVENKINTKGRLTGYELDCIVQAMQNKGDIRSNQVLLLIRCCGSVATNEKPEVRMAYAEKVWNSIKASGVELDISHYNAYLKVQMENEQPIQPFQYLKSLEDKGLAPNRVTYQCLITYCCLKGDLGGATELLERMKSKNYLLNENIFNALVMGHCVAGDVPGAEGVMNIMKEKDIFITSKTYSMFLCGLAISGNIEKMRSVMEECSRLNIDIRGTRLMDVIYYLFINGHNEYAEELLKSMGEITNFRDIIVLQYRLLHKKQFDGYFKTLDLMSNETDMIDRMRLALRYLGNKEDMETILKFKDAFDKKGLNVDVMKNILYYSLMSKNTDRSYRIIEYLHKSGQQIKQSYFVPLFIEAAKNKNFDELFQLTNAMTYTYVCDITSGFLARCMFDHLKLNEKQMMYLIGGLSVQVPMGVIFSGFIKSIQKKQDLKSLQMLTENYRVPPRIFDDALDIMVIYLKDKHNLSFVTDILAKWIRSLKSDINQKSSETEKSQTHAPVSLSDVENTVNNLAIKIFRKCDKSIAEDFLDVAVKENFPISTEVIDIIRQNENTDTVVFPGEKISDGKSASEAEISESQELSENPKLESDLVFDQFMKHRYSGNISEMEKLFDEHEKLQTQFGFKRMVEALKVLDKDDEVMKYLRKYYEIFSQDNKVLSKNLLLEAEMINRGMLKEAVTLIGKRSPLRKSNYRIITEMCMPIFERANPDEIKEFLNIQESSNATLINLQDMVDNLVKRGFEETVVKILKFLDEKDINSIDCSKSLIPSLYNKKKFECMEKLIEFIEENPVLKNFGSDLVFLYACTGKIGKGRELLDSEPVSPLLWIKNIRAVNADARIEVLENAIAILKGYESLLKSRIYEHLLVHYEQDSVSPDKALDLWLQLQEDNIQPSPKFLYVLAQILKKAGREVPFHVPSTMESLKVFIPQSFSWDIKTAIWNIRNNDALASGKNKLLDLLLENRLDEYHVSKILSVNENINPGIKAMLDEILFYLEWKKAYDEGLLMDYAKKFIDSENLKAPEQGIKNLPVQFLVRLIVSPSLKQSRPVSQILLWAYLQNCPEYSLLAEILKPGARKLVKSGGSLQKVLSALEREPPAPKIKKVIAFLLSEGVFDECSDLKQRAENILNWRDHDKAEQIEIRHGEEGEDDFSFKNVLESQVEDKRQQATNGNQDSEKPESESADTVEGEKRTSGAGPNL